MVEARYTATLGAAVGATILYALYGRVLFAFATERLLERWPGTPGWESVEGLLAFFLGGLGGERGLPAVLLPLGAGEGHVALRGERGPGDRRAGRSSSGGDRSPGRWVTPRRSWGPRSPSIVALVAAAALGWLSLRFSVRFYDRRDL